MKKRKNENKKKQKKENKKVKKIVSCFNDNSTEASSPSFGDDILYEILSRIPLKSLKQFKLVCKRWQSIIKDPNFGTLHFSRFKPTLDDTTLLIHPLGIREEHAGESPILFSLNLFGGGTPIPMKVDLGRPLDKIRMLKPVKGLICFVEGTSVVIFNPSTREKTSWIQTTTSSSVGKRKDKKMSRYYIFGFGFGFDETTKKHKVVCICEIFSKPRTYGKSPRADHRVCEVLTVGDNTWRKIDNVPPPYNLHLKGESVYADGAVYWRDENDPRPKVIVAFHVEKETFRVVKVSAHMKDNWRNGGPQSVHLAESYGRMALLDVVGEMYIKYWVYPYDIDDNFDYVRDWSENRILGAPFRLNGERYLAFQAIEGTGTDLVILQSFYKPIKLESLYYFDEDKDHNDRFKQVEIRGMSSFPTPKFGYEIRTFVECLLPVQNQQN